MKQNEKIKHLIMCLRFTVLKYPSSAIVKRLEIQSVWERVNQHLTKRLKQESQNQLRSAMSEGG